jgi:hypothetical protein
MVAKMIRETSIEAYKKIKEDGLLSRRRWQVYDFVFYNGPCTSREAYKKLCKGNDINPSSYLSRFSELRDAGVLSEIGKKFDHETGNTVILWDVTSKLPIKLEPKIKINYKELVRVVYLHRDCPASIGKILETAYYKATKN